MKRMTRQTTARPLASVCLALLCMAEMAAAHAWSLNVTSGARRLFLHVGNGTVSGSSGSPFGPVAVPAPAHPASRTRPADAKNSNWRSYLERLPNDPWGRPYQYLNPGANGEIDVFSLGADGEPDGDGVNADIGSWQL